MLNFFLKTNKPFLYNKKIIFCFTGSDVFVSKKGNKFFDFFKKTNKFNKYNLIFCVSIFLLFFFKNTILLKKFYYLFIKYNSFKKHKFLLRSFFYFFKKFFYFFKKKHIDSAYLLKVKGRISSKGSAKKKKIQTTRGSFYLNNYKKVFFDKKPSSNKQGCVNLSLVFKIN
jgi:hypothetical protein